MATTDEPKTGPNTIVLLFITVLLAFGSGTGFLIVDKGISPQLLISSIIPAKSEKQHEHDSTYISTGEQIITISGTNRLHYIKFTGELEIPSDKAELMNERLPELIDLTHQYLSQLTISDFTQPAALLRTRAKLLYMAQLEFGDTVAQDYLVTQFVVK